MNLLEEQQALEHELSQGGYNKFKQEMEKARQKGRLDTTKIGIYLLEQKLEILSQQIKTLQQNTDKPGKGHKQLRWIKDMNPDLVAFLTLKTLLASIDWSKDSIALIHVSGWLADTLEAEALAKFLEEKSPVDYKQTMTRLPKVSGDKRKRTALIGIVNRLANGTMKPDMPAKSELAFTYWHKADKVVIGNGRNRLCHNTDRPRNSDKNGQKNCTNRNVPAMDLHRHRAYRPALPSSVAVCSTTERL